MIFTSFLYMNEVQIKNKYGKCVWITTNLGERSSSGCKQVFDPAIDSTIICSSLFTAMVSIVDCIVANSHCDAGFSVMLYLIFCRYLNSVGKINIRRNMYIKHKVPLVKYLITSLYFRSSNLFSYQNDVA